MKSTIRRACLLGTVTVCVVATSLGWSYNVNEKNLATLQQKLLARSLSFSHNYQMDMLSGTKRFIQYNNETIVVYDYTSTEDMEKDLSRIDKTASIVGNSMVEWASTPHFYKNDTSIISYVGENREIVRALNKLLGSQFAGR